MKCFHSESITQRGTMSLSAFADSVFPNYVGAVGSLTVEVGGCRDEGRSGVLVGRRERLQGAFPCKCALMPTLLGGCSRQSGQLFVTTIHLGNDSQPIFNSSPPAKCRQECEATPSKLGGAVWMKAN